MCKDGYVCVSVERSHMQLAVSLRSVYCSNATYVALLALFVSWTSYVFSILVSSNLTLCCLALFFRIRSLLFLPRRDLSSRALSLLALHSANPEPYP